MLRGNPQILTSSGFILNIITPLSILPSVFSFSVSHVVLCLPCSTSREAPTAHSTGNYIDSVLNWNILKTHSKGNLIMLAWTKIRIYNELNHLKNVKLPLN